ncbi:MAG: dihydrofolate reductase family protein [Bacteroidota bacterium]
MRSVILFIATSLDGYIAGKDGNLDWLFTDGDYGYGNFINSIDTTLMGYNTYNDILSFGEYPYPDKKNYVFSRTHKKEDDHPTEFIYTDIPKFVRELKNKKGKNIWLVGGGQVNTVLWNEGLIDELIISVHPVILGEGVTLFSGKKQVKNLKLNSMQKFDNGLVQLRYTILNK